MQNRLQILHVTQYPTTDSIIAIERKRADAYYIRVDILDVAVRDLISQLKEEYGSKSENFLKSNRVGPSFHKGTGTGSTTIPSYARFYEIDKKTMVVFFDFNIKPIIEDKVQHFNEQNQRMEQAFTYSMEQFKF